MEKRTGFIGHHINYFGIYSEQLSTIVEELINDGCKRFIMGSKGYFDSLSLSVCKKLRTKYKDIVIEVVIPSYHTIEKNKYGIPTPYDDVNTVIFDVDDVFYKQKPIERNKKMIDQCDTLICLVDNSIQNSGAKTAMNYAKKKGLKIINLLDTHYPISKK